MKVLIWILTFFVGTLLNTLLGYATGIKAGAVLLYIAEFFVARKLCEKWDERQKDNTEKITKQDNNKLEKCDMCDQLSDNLVSVKIVDSMGTRYRNLCPSCVSKYNAKPIGNKDDQNNSSAQKSERKPMYCRICGTKLITNSLFCSKCGTKVEEVDDNDDSIQ